MTYLCPVPLSATALSALREYMAGERAEAKRLILDSDRIEQGIQGGKERMAERDRIHYGRTTKEMPNGGWDRLVGGTR